MSNSNFFFLMGFIGQWKKIQQLHDVFWEYTVFSDSSEKNKKNPPLEKKPKNNKTKNYKKPPNPPKLNWKMFPFHAGFRYTVSHQRRSLKRENTFGIWTLLCWMNGDACHAFLNLLMTSAVFWWKYFFSSSYLCHSSSFSAFVLLDGTSASHPHL